MAFQIIKWQKPDIDKQVLRTLTQRNNVMGFAQIISEFLITAAAGISAWYAVFNLPLWMGLTALYLYFIVYSWLTREGAFHELLHRTVFVQKGLNDFFFYILTFLGWMNPVYVRQAHQRHHHATLHEEHDMDVALSLDFGWIDILFALTFHLRHFIVELQRLTSLAMGRVDGDFNESVFPESDLKLRKKMFRISRINIALHLLLMALFILTGQWLLILMINFGSFFATWPHLLVSMTQHVGMKRNVDDFRVCSRSIKADPILGYFYWQMQYHIEHHLYPGVPFYNLKKLRKHIAYYLPERKYLFGAWKEIIIYLNRRKTNPDYYVPVDLPDNN